MLSIAKQLISQQSVDHQTGAQAYIKASKNPAKFCHDFTIFREKPYQALFLKSRGINR